MYPNSALSAGQLTIMAVVIVAVLAAWLIAVFLAARQPRDKSAAVSAGRRDEEAAATVTQLPSKDRPSGKAAALSGITRGNGKRPTITWRCDDRPDCQAADSRSVGLA